MGKDKLVHPVRYGLHASQVKFQPGEWILPFEEHKKHVNYQGLSDKKLTYFTAIPDDPEDADLDLIISEAAGWGQNLFLTEPYGPQYFDRNLTYNRLARVCAAQKVCAEIQNKRWENYVYNGEIELARRLQREILKERFERMIADDDQTEGEVPSLYWRH